MLYMQNMLQSALNVKFALKIHNNNFIYSDSNSNNKLITPEIHFTDLRYYRLKPLTYYSILNKKHKDTLYLL